MRPIVASLLAMLCLMLAGAAQAEVNLKDKAQLVSALSAKPPCCVIDGRNVTSRKREILEGALPWRSDLKINPTATVVVIADRDQDALGIANTLGGKHPGKPIFAVKGGLATWKAASLSLLVAAGMDTAMSGPVSFVIPANTCEQGKPLQELRPDKKK
ncbi:MAG: hypothetical protein NTY05_06145 [Rhodocyclales bacterium]|nr:hypothetical protein [Rhodocyclales bacterium]